MLTKNAKWIACAAGCTDCDSNGCSTCSSGLQRSEDKQSCEPIEVQSDPNNTSSAFETCPDGQYNAGDRTLNCKSCNGELTFPSLERL